MRLRLPTYGSKRDPELGRQPVEFEENVEVGNRVWMSCETVRGRTF